MALLSDAIFMKGINQAAIEFSYNAFGCSPTKILERNQESKIRRKIDKVNKIIALEAKQDSPSSMIRTFVLLNFLETCSENNMMDDIIEELAYKWDIVLPQTILDHNSYENIYS